MQDNGGTILAISSKDFAVIAGDTRQSEGYSIQTRYAPKVTQLTEECCIAVNGFAADGKELVKQIKQKLQVCPPSSWPFLCTLSGEKIS